MGCHNNISGGGRTVNSVAKTKDFRELENYMQAKYGISISNEVKNLNFNAVQEALQGVESMFGDYPELKNSIKEIKTNKTGVMSCSGSSINFNPQYFSGIDANARLKATAQRNSASHWWTPNASTKSNGIHETAHALVWHMTQKYVDNAFANLPPNAKSLMAVRVWNSGAVAKQIVDTATKRAKKQNYGKGKGVRDLAQSVSGYANHYNQAGKRAHEIIAESFADVRTNGISAAPFSHEVYKAANEYYKNL